MIELSPALSACDALYVAERLDAPLVTADAKLARAVRARQSDPNGDTHQGAVSKATPAMCRPVGHVSSNNGLGQLTPAFATAR